MHYQIAQKEKKNTHSIDRNARLFISFVTRWILSQNGRHSIFVSSSLNSKYEHNHFFIASAAAATTAATVCPFTFKVTFIVVVINDEKICFFLFRFDFFNVIHKTNKKVLWQYDWMLIFFFSSFAAIHLLYMYVIHNLICIHPGENDKRNTILLSVSYVEYVYLRKMI